MTADRNPTFAELIDWAEGRLEEPRRGEIAALLRRDPASAESVAWIERFHDAARLMPLETPPPAVSAGLRELVAERTAPWRPATYSVGTLALSGAAATAQGTRASGSTVDDATLDLVFDTELGTVRVGVGPGSAGLRIRITTERRLGDDAEIRAVLTSGDRVRGTARSVSPRELEAADVSADVDRVWLVHAGTTVRLDLGER